MKNTISACIIVKNEEKHLEDCLLSLGNYVDEIIIVDTGSIDSTREIAKKYTNNLFYHEWNDDFSSARNFSLDKANSDYALIIDADERLINPHLLKSTVINKSNTTGGWLIEVSSIAKRQNGTDDKFVSSLLRLFKNQQNIRFEGIIHEQVLESILRAGYKIEKSPIKFLHIGYSHDKDFMKSKQLRNLILLNKSIELNPDSSHDYYQRAKTYLALGDLNSAELDIQQALKLGNDNLAVYPQSLNFGAVIAFQRKEYTTSIERAKSSLKLIPNQAFAYYILGETYLEISDFSNSLNSYLNTELNLKSDDIIVNIVGDYHVPKDMLNFKIGRCYLNIPNYQLAINRFEKAIDINPTNPAYWIGLGNAHFKLGDLEKSISSLEKAKEIDPHSPEVDKYLAIAKGNQFNSAFDNQSNNSANNHQNNNPIDLQTDEEISKQDGNHYYPTEMHSKTSKRSTLISLTMIVKNEEVHLEDCLKSVRGIADEIILVDTGSTDGTKEIAQKYGAKIFDFLWQNDFSKARNYALQQATGQWILYLDADERIVVQSTDYLINLLTNCNKNIGGFICTIESEHIQLDGDSELHRGGYPRIFRNYGYPAIRFIGRVHEQITPSIFALNKSIDYSSVVIKHLGYNSSREIMEAKIKRNYSLLIEHVKDEPTNGYAWYQLGQTLAQMRLNKEAEAAIRFAIDTKSLSNSIFASATATLSQITGNKRDFVECNYWADQSLEKAPNQIYALHLKAYAMIYLNYPAKAIELFNKVLDRIKNVGGVPKSGFDIVVPEEIVKEGIKMAKELMDKK